jgi:hypothetical protein
MRLTFQVETTDLLFCIWDMPEREGSIHFYHDLHKESRRTEERVVNRMKPHAKHFCVIRYTDACNRRLLKSNRKNRLVGAVL